MGKYFSLKQNREPLKNILDENFPPVARFRLLSQGLSSAHCLEDGAHLVGDRSCLACGNCVDACPQVRRMKGQLSQSNNRTSMQLENIVDNSCVRCYSCIGSCPQVDRQMKNFAVRFRITEKMVHWFLVLMWVAAAASGIGLNHFKAHWDPSFIFFVGIVHRIFAVGVLLSPVLLYMYDREHFMRIVKKSFFWSSADWSWMKDAVKYFRGDRSINLYQGEFNPGQKYWYVLIMGAFVVLGISGIVQWIGEPVFSKGTIEFWRIIHVVYALTVDVSLAVHIFRKALRLVIRLKELFNDDLTLPYSNEKEHVKHQHARINQPAVGVHKPH